MILTALHIKTSLMHYFRFQRQWVCADEVAFNWGRADILVDTGKEIIEAEVKISKSDLLINELKKEKHQFDSMRCNRFFICVPTRLVDDAVAWCEKVNQKYGVIECRSFLNVYIVRSAKPLGTEYPEEIRRRILKRLSVKVYDSMHRQCIDLNDRLDTPDERELSLAMEEGNK